MTRRMTSVKHTRGYLIEVLGTERPVAAPVPAIKREGSIFFPRQRYFAQAIVCTGNNQRRAGCSKRWQGSPPRLRPDALLPGARLEGAFT